MFMPSGVAAASATGRYNLLAGTDATNSGYSNGNVIGAIGTLTPNELYGLVVQGIYTSSGDFWFQLPANAPNTDASWNQCKISGVFTQGQNTLDVLRANATLYIPDFLGAAQWSYTTGAGPGLDMISGNAYTVILK